MFKIDRSVVKYIDSNISDVITQIQPQEAPEKEPEERQAEKFVKASAFSHTPTPDITAMAMERAQKLVDDAHEMAETIIEEARNEAAAILEEARNEGVQKGKEEAAEEYAQYKIQLNGQFEAFLKELRQWEIKRDEIMEANILQLSLEIAEKIIAMQISDNDAIFMSMVKEAVNRLNAKDKFTIHLNQREYDRFFAKDDGALFSSLQSAPFSVCPDANVNEGGIVLVGQDGTVKAGVDVQLKNAKNILIPLENGND